MRTIALAVLVLAATAPLAAAQFISTRVAVAVPPSRLISPELPAPPRPVIR